MTRTTQELQRQVLAELAAQGAKRDFIAEFYIFGSVARDEDDPNDIDLAFQYNEAWVQRSGPVDHTVEDWEAGLADWAASLSITFLLRVSLHDLRDPSDLAREDIIRNRDSPLYTIGKTKLVYTPPSES